LMLAARFYSILCENEGKTALNRNRQLIQSEIEGFSRSINNLRRSVGELNQKSSVKFMKEVQKTSGYVEAMEKTIGEIVDRGVEKSSLFDFMTIYKDFYHMSVGDVYEGVYPIFYEDIKKDKKLAVIGKPEAEVFNDKIVILTKPASIKHNKRIIDFGNYFITYSFQVLNDALRSGNSAAIHSGLRLSSPSPRYPKDDDGDNIHPHISGNGMCTGEAGYRILSFLQQGVLSGVFQLVNSILNTLGSGPYRAISAWDPRPSCAGCGEIIGEDDERVNCSSNGAALHKSCAYEDEDGNFHEHRFVKTCTFCFNEGVFDDRTTRGGNVGCPLCIEELSRVENLVNEGKFPCPNCNHVHEGEDAFDHKIELGEKDYACTRCVSWVREPNEDGVGTCEVEGIGRVTTSRIITQRSRRSFPRIPNIVVCSCGSRVAEENIRRDDFAMSNCCQVCDPDNLGMSQSFLAQVPIMEAWLWNFYGTHIGEMTTQYCRLYSFVGEDVSAERAASVVKRLRCWEINLSRTMCYVDRHTSLREKAIFWETVLADTGFIILTADEESIRIHDEIQRFRTEDATRAGNAPEGVLERERERIQETLRRLRDFFSGRRAARDEEGREEEGREEDGRERTDEDREEIRAGEAGVVEAVDTGDGA